MHTSHLSSKGQVVIPKALRAMQGLKSGVVFKVKAVDKGILLTPVHSDATLKAEDVVGCLKYKGPKKSLKDMEAAIQKGALKRK
ncbi:MAG: AbrB family transcriptional regulator [Legionellaceae bacterium]|nr:AbrB family transcriptional regulator [Legionellaceae bacterium]